MAEGRKSWPKVEDEWFVEPEAATGFLLAREAFSGPVLDPACGGGNIVRACRAAGLDAYGMDLKVRPGAEGEAWFLGTGDFLAPWRLRVFPSVIVNPPYGRALLAEAFIRRAVTMPKVRKVAVFLNSKFLFGAGRATGLYTELPPTRVYPISPRPSCPPGAFLLGGGKAQGGVENFIWAVWAKDEPPGRTEFIWN